MNGTEIVVGGNVYRTLEAQVYNNKERLDSLDIETLEGLPDAFEQLDTKVDGIDDRLVTAEGDIVDIKQDVQDLDQDINGTGGIEDRLTVAEENIGTSAGDISQLQYDLGEAQGDISALGTSKLDAPTAAGNVGDVIVKAASGTEWQAVAPFNPNGDYPNVTVGKAVVAKNIEAVSENSGSLQDEPFFFQATATENNTASTPTAPQFELKALRGNTVVYNQLVDGVNLTYNTISGHKYWTYISATDYTAIVTSSGSTITVSDAQKDKIIDLTRWFNGNIPQSIIDDPTIFPINYWDQGLAYSAGILVDCSCTELETVGFNQFDKSTATDGYIDVMGTQTSSPTRSCSDFIRIIPNTVYYGIKLRGGSDGTYCANYYDSSKNYLSFATFGGSSTYTGTFTTPANASYVRINFFTADKDDVCVNLHWDGERDGTYEPYVSHTYPMVWSGKSAGSVYDEKLPDGTEIANVGSVDLGSLNWTYMSAYDAFYTGDLNSLMPHISGNNTNAICSDYVQNTLILDDTSLDMVMVMGSSGNFWIRDKRYTDPAVFKTALSGVTLYYELATPTTSSGDAFTSVIEGDDYGTMAFDSVVPVGNEFFYPADYALLIDDLNNYVNGDVSDLVKFSAFPIPSPSGLADGTYSLKATVSGGIATISWEAD